MYHIAPNFRHALRAAAVLAALLVLSAALLAAALPHLIDGRAVRTTLSRALSTWSGGPVIIEGPVRIASFATLSIKASNVRFAASPRLSPVRRLEAKSITATAHLASLLRGRLEFKSVTLDEPKIYLSRKSERNSVPLFGLDTVSLAAISADRNVFEHLDFQNATLIEAAGGRTPYRRIGLQRVRLDRGLAGSNALVPAAFYVKQDGLEAYFRGVLDDASQTAQGSIRFSISPTHPAASRIVQLLTPWERDAGFFVTGDLTWSGARASLENANLSFGDHLATGSLALAIRRGRALLEGTLAYDQLGLANTAEDQDGDLSAALRPLIALEAFRARLDPNLDLDIRISAERMAAGATEDGPLALALTSRAGRFSADVAELTAFGGKITGRADYDPARPASLSLTASGSRLDATALATAIGLPFAVSGPASVRLAMTVPLLVKEDGQGLRAAAGTFSIGFPSGGSLDGDVSRQLSLALERRDLFWGLGASSFPFSVAQIDGTATVNGITLNIDGEHNGKRIAGSLRVASASHAVSGSLALTDIEDDATAQEQPAAPARRSADLLLSGTAAALNILPAGKSSISN